MTTFGDLVTQVTNYLHSYTTHEQLTWLTGAVTSTTQTALAVNDGDKISQGVVEIGSELLYVASVTDNALTIAPFGRGYQGSTATTHTINSRVVFDPHFPAVEVKRAINQVLQGTYPKLYARKETTFTFAGSVATYELPAEAEGIIKVQYQMSGPSGYWPTLTAWEFEPNSELPSGKAITFHVAPEQSSTVKVTYWAPFTALSLDGDTLAGAGFPESAVDVLVYGACSQLIRFLDVSRLQVASVENLSRAQVVQSGDPAKIANQLYAMYVQRLDEERKKLLEQEPPQMHFTR